jgi:hypothetical protein
MSHPSTGDELGEQSDLCQLASVHCQHLMMRADARSHPLVSIEWTFDDNQRHDREEGPTVLKRTSFSKHAGAQEKQTLQEHAAQEKGMRASRNQTLHWAFCLLC